MVQDKGMAALSSLRETLDVIFAAIYRGESIATMDFSDRPYAEMVAFMHKYICFIIEYPTLQAASEYDRTYMYRELKAYLLGMMQQTEDNTVYASQTSWNTWHSPASSYLKWVRTLGSDHVSGFSSSAFFFCHLSPNGEVFPSPELKFIAQDCVSHISVLCRIWNDWGSMTRDIAERNINGMNFPEFRGMDEQEVKIHMRHISDYERRCLHKALEELRDTACSQMGEKCGTSWFDAFSLFFRGAEVYNSIYEFKDISAW